MFGENLGTGTLFKTLDDYVGYAEDAYDRGDYGEAADYALSLMYGAAVLWTRMVEERAEGDD